MYRRRGREIEVLLGHPGGPLWAKKDLGAWTIPKGEVEPPEDPRAAACREFSEETGLPPGSDLLPLGELKQKSGKLISAWAFEGDCDPACVRSQSFTMEWPPRSGKKQEFPEIDRAAWFSLEEGASRILPGQAGFLRELARVLSLTRH
jgi:predicted NUDIX family NTP pyrophosphohydrolase